MLKKGIVWFLVSIMLFSFAACGKSDDKTNTTTATNQTTSSSDGSQVGSTLLYDKLTTWRVLTPNFPNAPLKGDQLTFKEMEKRTNVRLEIDDTTAASDYVTKLNMLLASGDLPEILVTTAVSTVSKYISQGIFADLTPYMQTSGKDYLQELSMNPVAQKNCITDDGKYYFFTQLSLQVDAPVYMINKPWLDKLGLQIPKTTDELYTVLKAFKTLGSDIVPWTKGQFFNNLEYGAFIPFGTWDNFKLFPDGKYAYGPYERSNELKSALKWLNKLYTEGLIDQEYLTLDNDSYVAKFNKGEVGFVYGYPAKPIWNSDASGKIIEPRKSDWQFIPAIQGPTGIKNAFAIIPTAGPTFITKSIKEPEKAVKYFNYFYTNEGKELFNFGIKGTSFNVVDGKNVYTDMIIKHEAGPVNGLRYNGITPNNFPFDRVPEMTEASSPKQTYEAMIEAAPLNEPSAPILIGSADEEKQLADIMVNVNKYVIEMIPKFIEGSVSIDSGFDGFIAQLKKFKIEDAIAIKKAQYDRWNSRK